MRILAFWWSILSTLSICYQRCTRRKGHYPPWCWSEAAVLRNLVHWGAPKDRALPDWCDNFMVIKLRSADVGTIDNAFAELAAFEKVVDGGQPGRVSAVPSTTGREPAGACHKHPKCRRHTRMQNAKPNTQNLIRGHPNESQSRHRSQMKGLAASASIGSTTGNARGPTARSFMIQIRKEAESGRSQPLRK